MIEGYKYLTCVYDESENTAKKTKISNSRYSYKLKKPLVKTSINSPKLFSVRVIRVPTGSCPSPYTELFQKCGLTTNSTLTQTGSRYPNPHSQTKYSLQKRVKSANNATSKDKSKLADRQIAYTTTKTIQVQVKVMPLICFDFFISTTYLCLINLIRIFTPGFCFIFSRFCFSTQS